MSISTIPVKDRLMSEMYDSADFERMFQNESKESRREPFEVDKGRIIHSGSFRRLQGKTQVLGAGERDFYRTRLTHSLEVAQLGRGLPNELQPISDFRPNLDLIETICLAHDIGHAPFGHFGEKHLHELMREYGGFGANPQNLRIAASLEPKYPEGGLDLSRAALDGLIKYPILRKDKANPNSSKFTYDFDEELLAWVKNGVVDPSRNPIEGQIADWADQMAYSVNDIEDAVRAGLIDFADMTNQADKISTAARKQIDEYAEGEDGPTDYVVSISEPDAISKLSEEMRKSFVCPSSFKEKKMNLKAWTSKWIKELKEGCEFVLTHPDEQIKRYKYTLKTSPKARARAAVLKGTVKVLVFQDPRVHTLEHKAGEIMDALFRAFTTDQKLLPRDYQELISIGGHPIQRFVADFISGMTDKYAFGYYSRLFQPGWGSFYEDV
jgi:dGTPase